jgi:hypothetical protein
MFSNIYHCSALFSIVTVPLFNDISHMDRRKAIKLSRGYQEFTMHENTTQEKIVPFPSKNSSAYFAPNL